LKAPNGAFFLTINNSMTYTEKVSAKIVILYAVALIGVPLWFVYAQPTLGQVVLWFVVAALVSRIANAGYHRWLTHAQFQPTWIGRKIMLWFMVMTAEAPPGHYVVSHLQHHANTDKEGDPHGPLQIGFKRLFFGQYDEVKPKVGFLRYYSKQKDAQFVTKHYWRLYLGNMIVLGLISKWLVVWLAFMFAWSWIWFLVINWGGHGGTKATPTNLNWFCNIFMGGEDYHANHHDKPGQLVMGRWDTTGKYIVPWLLSK
jgi:stearoyl-CoA desaturase (delta-9 desaturase)